MVSEKAEIMEDRCISCGNCLITCPQRARSVVNDVSHVKEAIKSGKTVVASIAPSYPGAFNFKEAGQIVSALKKLGFSYVEETGVGAEIVNEMYKEKLKEKKYANFITTSCPSANYLIEKYYPSLIKFMAPVVSPMVAHGKLIKKHYGKDSFAVFIGPCIAKKNEAVDDNVIDEVLTFGELSNWLLESNINILDENPLEFSHRAGDIGKSYPVSGGVLKDLNDVAIKNGYESIKVNGMENCMELFDNLVSGELSNVLVEANVCKGGCIGGPSMVLKSTGYYKRLKRVTDYAGEKSKSISYEKTKINKEELYKEFHDKSIKKEKPSEKEIQNILRKLGKFDVDDELNCGGCGYESCRDHAIAIFEDMSEISMCFPYIRGKAESLKNVIFENSPNVIIILDEDLVVKEFNPTAEELFSVSSSEIKDRHISELLDDLNFKKVLSEKNDILGEKVKTRDGKITLLENIIYINKQSIILAIMKDITEEEKNKGELLKVKENTLNAAQEVIDKQMRVAQEIASLLGETTAETKVILTKLKKLTNEEI